MHAAAPHQRRQRRRVVIGIIHATEQAVLQGDGAAGLRLVRVRRGHDVLKPLPPSDREQRRPGHVIRRVQRNRQMDAETRIGEPLDPGDHAHG